MSHVVETFGRSASHMCC